MGEQQHGRTGPSPSARSAPSSTRANALELVLQALGVRGTVSSPSVTDEQLTDLCRDVQDTSPVRDTLAGSVPVTTTLDVV